MPPITKPHKFTIGVALDGAGWHPAAWREADANPRGLFSAEYWAELAGLADAAGLDYATFEDTLSQPATRGDRVTGRLDALLTASWIAPRTTDIGLIPTVTVTHTEPFHVATALQTLDHLSGGRGGWQLRVSADRASAAAFGRREAPHVELGRVAAGEPGADLEGILDEAADVAEVARRLWDSWDVDAEIRDTDTGRFLDRDRVRHINFVGERFSVVGPSIVPRSPQGQLPVTVLSHAPRVHELAAASADVVFITPANESPLAGASSGRSVSELVAEVRLAEQRVGRDELGLDPLRIVADLVVAIDAADESAVDRLDRLDALAGEPFESDARTVAGSAAGVAALIEQWRDAGIDGVRLRPLTLPGDLRRITTDLLPLLRERGIAEEPLAGAAPRTLRERFDLAPILQEARA